MNGRRKSWVRAAFPVALLVLAIFFLHAHSRAEILPMRKRMASFPARIGPWDGTTLTIPAEDLSVLGPGEFLERNYQHLGTQSIDLFLAYFASQRSGDTIHSPKHCLPGSGWTPITSTVIHVPWGNGNLLNANYYVLQLGLSREVVIYWFQSEGRTVASEYWQRIYLIADALRHNRTDGALVRVITVLAPGEQPVQGKDRALAFTKRILPMLGEYIPR
ncbi:MAG: exosortase C-terminal domain/associated protein EpsI [Terriglobia bacterium]